MTPSVLHQLHRVSRDGFCRLVDKILESPPGAQETNRRRHLNRLHAPGRCWLDVKLVKRNDSQG